jgi:hypothetical protein
VPGSTPAKGIRYPLLTEPADVNAIMAMTFDLDTMGTADDALRTTALTQRGARINHSAPPTIVKAVQTKLTFNTVDYDPNGLTNLGVNNDRFTIVRPGLYLFGLVINWQSAGAFGGLGMTAGEAIIAKNTTAAPVVPNKRHRKSPGFNGSSSGSVGCTIVAPLVMAATDFVTAQVLWAGSAAGPATIDSPIFWVLPLALT